MSWMDSWSRPSANSKVPAPLYLSNENIPYCHTCGRVISSKKQPPTSSHPTSSTSAPKTTPPKYCSTRCRANRPTPADRCIEAKIASLLNNESESGIELTAARSRVVKGDPRLIVTCDEIEAVLFGSRFDPEKTAGRRKNRRPRGKIEKEGEWRSVDMVSDDDDYEDDEGGGVGLGVGEGEAVAGVHVRLPQDKSLVNFSVGGERGKQEKIEESEADAEKRREGARRAEEREMVRKAARRVVVFGVPVPVREGLGRERESKAHAAKGKKGKSRGKGRRGGDEDENEEDKDGEEDEKDKGLDAGMEMRKAEAIMAGMVVEPSFAKGNWSVRWRE